MSVYFIACGGFIKVGYSDNPERRAAKLFSSTSRYSAPRAAYQARGTQTLLGAIEGDKGTELQLHGALNDYAVGCEWFVDEPELRTYLAALDDDHDDDFLWLSRPTGRAWDTVPIDDRGGHNAELALQLVAGLAGQTARSARRAS